MRHLGPLSQIALGFVLGFAALGVVACASVAPLVECKLTAVHKVLGENPDPDQVTLFDLKDVASRLKACHAKPDGGQ